MSEARLRLDKWLWHARFFKTRSLATKIVGAGKVRVDGTLVSKASRMIEPGNVLTFAKDDHVRVIKIVALGERRGPAPEAQALYEDLDPPVFGKDESAPARVGSRPTKRDRRRMDRDRDDAREP